MINPVIDYILFLLKYLNPLIDLLANLANNVLMLKFSLCSLNVINVSYTNYNVKPDHYFFKSRPKQFPFIISTILPISVNSIEIQMKIDSEVFHQPPMSFGSCFGCKTLQRLRNVLWVTTVE